MKQKVSFLFIILALVMVFGIAFVQPAEALLDKHECSFCHDFHGAISNNGLLKYSSVEVLCLSCHSTINGSTEAANVHNPLGLNSDQPGYITCRECHDAHDNQGGNVKMVGYKKDSQNWDETFTAPAIRKELPSTVGLTYNVVTFTGPTDFNIAGSVMGACEVCHPGNHQEGNDCTSCHSHSGQFIPSSGGDCRACHDGTGAAGTAKAVSVDSPHSTNTLSLAGFPAFTCENCHTDHTSGSVMIPNYNAVGINYGTGGISLGNSGGGLYNAAGLTEAEICWNCHATYGVSEWGVNTDTNGAGVSNYDFGSLSGGAGTPWVDSSGSTGATWTSGEAAFGYKTGPIMSTHSVNHYNSITTPGLNTRADIRCSYCHDVHELNALPNDSSSGAPYLRGTWKGSPYKEDGAPLSGMTYASQGAFGPVPRGGIGATETGGYQIDQNTPNNPTALGWTANDSSGLCALCHSSSIDDGDDRGLWDAGAIDSLNKFSKNESGADELPSDSWVGDGTDDNGHSNAVLGGSGSKKANIFNESWRKPNDGYCDPGSGTDVDGNSAGSDSYCAGYPNMANQQLNVAAAPWGGSFRGAASLGDQGFRVEPTIGANQPFAYQDYNWGAAVDIGTTDSQYHQFSCSKCHNPHASRLPRLMITNCLDVSHNTWDDAATILPGDSVSVAGADPPGKNGCDAGVNGTHAVTGVDIATNSIFIQSSAFASSCSRQNVTITWGGTPYSLSSVDFNDGAGPGGTDEIVLNADIDLENFIGRQIHSAGTVNLAGAATIQTDNDGVQLSLATSAQNCHRYYDANADGDAEDAGDQKGWNTVSPW